MKFFIELNQDGGIIKTPGYIAFALVILVILIVTASLTSKSTKEHFSTKQLVFCSVCLALAFVCSFLKLFELPMGGSVTMLSMFLICFIGYLYGPYVGIISAIAYGLLQLIVDPYIVYPLQLIFDYPLAFGALGLSGFFSKKKNGLIKGYLFGCLGRCVFSTLSGFIFFSEWAYEGWNPFIYSLSYNGSYIATEAVITIIVLMLPAVSKALQQIRSIALE